MLNYRKIKGEKIMKNTWVLSIRTSLPEVCESHGDLQTSIYTFDSFEAARTALRKVLKKYAFSENSMFDGRKYHLFQKGGGRVRRMGAKIL